KIMILGSGELGKEVTISAKRLGQYVIAVDNYSGAPAMQIADDFEVINMLDGNALMAIVKKHQPDIILPEVEAIRTEILKEFESNGIFVVPTATAAHLTMNREAIRNLAANELQLKTASFTFAQNFAEFTQACEQIGYPCVVKPIMSSSGKGQSVIKNADELKEAWDYAFAGARGDGQKVIIEEFINFDLEITLLTVKQKHGETLFVAPIGHRQERGDYQESWLPVNMSTSQLQQAQSMAKIITDRLGGAGLFGVEFFITDNDVYFSELSPRPHDTGMVTLISQNLSEFDLHVRAVLGLPIPQISYYGPSASHVILATKENSLSPQYSGFETALLQNDTDLRIFGKPSTRPFRRMGVALARGSSTDEARLKAKISAESISVF
ncbi:MAG: formate-dependent phosphoribosylglycinamide formyltransferase, partial [Bdellovibrionales bacterium]|nr:formate-dependent phosphoribosylglycinamide formyltransferase [Bdellovibrionales bacterium]